MPKCTFCSMQLEEGTGKIFVTDKGRPLAFCSRKCEKFSVRGTQSKRLKWASKVKV